MNDIILSASYSESLRDKARHYHDCHQLLFITEGEAEVTVAERRYIAQGGSIIIISRLEEHSIRITSPVYKRFAVRISPDIALMGNKSYLLFSVLTNRPAAFSHIADLSDMQGSAEALFKKLVEEKAECLPLGDEQCYTLLKLLLILLYRHSPKLFLRDDTSAVKTVKSIQSQLENNYGREYRLEQLAEEFNISKYYLSHTFKKITGYSPMSYLQYCRIAAAKKYLAETGIPISSIIELCGFSDNSNFSRSFKEQTGITPTEFRKKYNIK